MSDKPITDDEMLARLDAKFLYVLKHVKHPADHYPRDTYTVIFEEGDKIKIGDITSPFYHLHGIDTYATWNGRRHWFKSGLIADEMPDRYLEHMQTMFDGHLPMEDGKYLVLLDTSKLELSR